MRIPYIFLRSRRRRGKKVWLVLGKWKGKRFYIGDFDSRVDAFVEYNRVMGRLYGGGGLLHLQGRLRRGVRDRLLEEGLTRGVEEEEERVVEGEEREKSLDELLGGLGY